ncbi:rsc complex subunit protein [Rutstroemia sp. NJR-2017a BBW]|nr:rsc complex subunit protein [Rutstroemia sp. NJR-2017a BBW]
MPRASAPVAASHGSHNNAYNPPRQVEVYTLPDAANAAIPADIRSQFHTDEYGRIIFYTAPPLDLNPIPEDKQHLGHSLKYLAERVRRKEELEKKRKARAAELEAEVEERTKRIKADEEATKRFLLEAQVKTVEAWCEKMNKGTEELYRG